jgi:hypothetical protein
MSGEKPWQALVGGKLVGEARTLVVAQSHTMLNAPRGTEQSLKLVRHAQTGETHVRQPDGSWKRTDLPKPARRARFAAEASDDLRRARLPYKDD